MKDADKAMKALLERSPHNIKKTSVPISVADRGTVWLHLHLYWNIVHADARAWTTVEQNENSAPVNVGAIRVRLQFQNHEDKENLNAHEVKVFEDVFGVQTSASAEAWTKNPDMHTHV